VVNAAAVSFTPEVMDRRSLQKLIEVLALEFGLAGEEAPTTGAPGIDRTHDPVRAEPAGEPGRGAGEQTPGVGGAVLPGWTVRGKGEAPGGSPRATWVIREWERSRRPKAELGELSGLDRRLLEDLARRRRLSFYWATTMRSRPVTTWGWSA